jgi:hypothetical protein
LVEFTGERVIPGHVNDDLWSEHMARYAFARRYAEGKRVLDAGAWGIVVPTIGRVSASWSTSHHASPLEQLQRVRNPEGPGKSTTDAVETGRK